MMNKWWITATMGAGLVWAVALLCAAMMHAAGAYSPQSPNFREAWACYWIGVFLISALAWIALAQEYRE